MISSFTSALLPQELSLQHVSNILWTHASLRHLRPPMPGAFVAEIARRLASEPFNSQQLSNLLWSLCIAEVRAPLPPARCFCIRRLQARCTCAVLKGRKLPLIELCSCQAEGRLQDRCLAAHQ